MDSISILFAIFFLGWAVLDLFTGKSLYLTRFGMAEYDEMDDGFVYWLVVLGKFAAGAHFAWEFFTV
ncbi:hypothetical protein KKD52_15335 [Myxococcota bacterium]|jgi:hypothetical protein|nr:hypothetical protein [Myxococcota bacterium]MBU1413659.1 hypothetical protein [Myxococcota bacterium]MBU1511724.1 hypothetical protein [Myxococcota bacterium]PKN26810.1 MAG: hypothetical protein CVU65_04450 [Deltaproteobacteria bacterium HGW-Deltaproteobacteria-22]